jgi:hypothetical protein
VRETLAHVLASAPQFAPGQSWKALVHYIVKKIIAATAPNPAGSNAPPRLATG